jgi:hypothetical protein
MRFVIGSGGKVWKTCLFARLAKFFRFSVGCWCFLALTLRSAVDWWWSSLIDRHLCRISADFSAFRAFRTRIHICTSHGARRREGGETLNAISDLTGNTFCNSKATLLATVKPQSQCQNYLVRVFVFSLTLFPWSNHSSPHSEIEECSEIMAFPLFRSLLCLYSSLPACLPASLTLSHSGQWLSLLDITHNFNYLLHGRTADYTHPVCIRGCFFFPGRSRSVEVGWRGRPPKMQTNLRFRPDIYKTRTGIPSLPLSLSLHAALSALSLSLSSLASAAASTTNVHTVLTLRQV